MQRLRFFMDLSGNKDLLDRRLVAFFASRKATPHDAQLALHWVESICQTDKVVISGFHSPLEKEILNYLLERKHPVIFALGRALYKKAPPHLQTAFDEGNLLFISFRGYSRHSWNSAQQRNWGTADLKKLVDELGYDMAAKVQIASQHGVLQNRQRVIIVGWKRNASPKYGYPELEIEAMPYTVMNDLFSDLPNRKAGEGKLCEPISYTRPLSEMEYLEKSGIRGVLDFTTQHLARPTNNNDREIYKIAVEMWKDGQRRLNYAKLPARLQKHKNKETFLNRFSVVDPDGCCHTVVAHIAMDGHYYIYPTPNPTMDNVRSITVREAARLQSFPDDYFFEGSRTSALMQIGNAVPVILAQRIAEAIKKKL